MLRCQLLHRAFGVVAGEEGVGEIGRVADGEWIDPIQVLQIVSDVREAMHHRPRRADSAHFAGAVEQLRRGVCRRSGDGDIGAVRQSRVDP